MIFNFALLGNPVEHSLSPEIQTQFFRETGLKGGYICIPTESQNLLNNIKNLQALGFRGVNITIPYKEKVLEITENYSKEVKLIGVANTLIFDNLEIKAENTDWLGFSQSLPIDIQNKKALLIGAGGSAKAIVLALIKKKFSEIIVLIRNSESAKAGAENIKSSFAGLNCAINSCFINDLNIANSNFDLIVNASPVGMSGFNENESPLTESFIQNIVNKNCYFYDLIYNPEQTLFLKLANKHGFNGQNGYRMLFLQAAYAFKHWTKKDLKCLTNPIQPLNGLK